MEDQNMIIDCKRPLKKGGQTNALQNTWKNRN